MAAERVMAIVATLGKAVNLLRVEVPPVEPQILLKVTFLQCRPVQQHEPGQLGFAGANGNTQRRHRHGREP